MLWLGEKNNKEQGNEKNYSEVFNCWKLITESKVRI
jgi:hypothetical protein